MELLVVLAAVAEDLGQLDVRRRIARVEGGHLAQHALGRVDLAVLQVVVDEHLVLRARFGDQALLVVELGEPLVDRRAASGRA